MPIALESHGSYSKISADFISELGHRITAVTSDWSKFSFLFHKLSLAIRRFKAVCVYDTFIELDVYDTFIELDVYDTFIELDVYDTFIELDVYDTFIELDVYDMFIELDVYRAA